MQSISQRDRGHKLCQRAEDFHQAVVPRPRIKKGGGGGDGMIACAP